LNAAAALNAINDVNPISQAFDAGYAIGSGHVAEGVIGAALTLVPEAGPAVRILEREGATIIGAVDGAAGEGIFMGTLRWQDRTLFIDGVHTDGLATLKEWKAAAKSFGREQGASRVVIKPGVRRTGRRQGTIPNDIVIPVEVGQ